ncbi:MAG: hypothetical protein U0Y10_11940 [Spirosomataceae bacterium]
MKKLTVLGLLVGAVGLTSFSKIDKNLTTINPLTKEVFRKIKYEDEVRFLQENTLMNCENPTYRGFTIAETEQQKRERGQRDWLCSYGWVYREWAKTDLSDEQALAVAEYKYQEFTKQFANHPDLPLFKKYAITAILRDFGLLQEHGKEAHKKIAYYLAELYSANSRNTGLYYCCLKALGSDLSEEDQNKYKALAISYSNENLNRYQTQVEHLPTDFPDFTQRTIYVREMQGLGVIFFKADGSTKRDSTKRFTYYGDEVKDLSQVPDDKKSLFKEITLNEDEIRFRNEFQQSKRKARLEKIQQEVIAEKEWQALLSRL